MTSLYQTASNVSNRQDVTFKTLTVENLDVENLTVDDLTIFNSINSATGSVVPIGTVLKPFLSIYSVNSLNSNIVTQNISGTNGRFTNINITNLTGTNAGFTNVNITNLTGTNISSSDINATNITVANLTGTSGFITNFKTTNITGTNAFINNVTLSSAGGTGTALSFYQTESFQIAWIGAIAGQGKTSLARLTRVGNNVTITVPQYTQTTITATDAIVSNAIPSQYRPSASVFGTYLVEQNGTDSISAFEVPSTGIISLYSDIEFNDFTIGQTNSWASFTISYVI